MAKRQQNALLFDEQDAIDFLQSRGYRVLKVEYKSKPYISTIPELVEHFYSTRMFYHPERKFPESINHKNDRMYISSLVSSRQKLGLNKITAVKECAEIIDALFKYEELLNLKYPIYGPEILGSTYIVNRLCGFLNGEVPETTEVDSELMVQEHNKYYDKYCKEEDLRRAEQNRREILEGLYGKE